MKTYLPSVSALCLLAVTAFANAEEFPSPTALLDDTANKMFAAINKDRNKIKADPNHTQQLVEDLLMPNIDIITASKFVLGNHWDNANKEQKLRFIREFRAMLLRFYSSALSEYLNSHEDKLDRSIMKIFPVSVGEQKELMVRSEVQPKDGKPVPVLYHMNLTNKGWKVYDVTVEGVSVITTYKTSFASDIAQNGLDALIDSLVERNKKLVHSGPQFVPQAQKTSGTK